MWIFFFSLNLHFHPTDPLRSIPNNLFSDNVEFYLKV